MDKNILQKGIIFAGIASAIFILGYLGGSLLKPIGVVALILVPSALIISYQISKRVKEESKKKAPGWKTGCPESETILLDRRQFQELRHAKWVDRKIDSSRYEILQLELERVDGQRKEIGNSSL